MNANARLSRSLYNKVYACFHILKGSFYFSADKLQLRSHHV